MYETFPALSLGGEFSSPEPDVGVIESPIWDAETRTAHLQSLDAFGFRDEAHLENTIEEIVSIGLPVNKYGSLHYRPNKKGTEYHLGSWGSDREAYNYGEFSLYELLDKVVPEERLATISHEGMHGVSVLDPENAHIYGGEEKRAAAEQYVENVTLQSLITGVHLNSYHKKLIDDFKEGEISGLDLTEETFAILGEMALTNRNGLLGVQEKQKSALVDINRINRRTSQPEFPFQELITEEGSEEANGIDKLLVDILDGVSNVAELRDHTHRIKSLLYRFDNYTTVIEREVMRQYIPADAIILSYISSMAQEENELRKRKRKNVV